MNQASLSAFELSLYFIIWVFGVLFAIYKFSCENKVFSYIPDVYHDFKRSFLSLRLKKDATDYEWESMTDVIFKMLPWIGLHVLVSEILKRNHVAVLPYWQITIGFACITIITGIQGLCLILLQPLAFEFVSKRQSVFLIWITCFVSLACVSYFKTFDSKFGYDFLSINDLQHFLLILVICWTNLRCVSFYLDVIKNKDRTRCNNLLQILSFCFYLPNMATGPFLHYEQFEKSHRKNTTSLRKRITTLAKDLLRFNWWLLFTEVSLHFIYASAFSYQPRLVSKFNSWALYGYGYWMGQFFHLKYVVFYGLSTSIAKFESIPVPATPKCIGRIHLYSDMWKYFDRGLHSFLVRYIYVPALSKRSNMSKIWSSFLCFMFVYVWHGVQNFIMVWAALNFLGITLEALFGAFYKHYEKSISFLSMQWQRRLVCILASPLLAMSCISNFYFFAGMDIGNIFIRRALTDCLWNQVTLLSILYCCCQTSSEIKIWENTSDKRTTKLKNGK